ncbi:hypothetical protein HXA31_09470 [Salipaludibacillus agaradhaerens]|uniref:Uncharacterized protein n=1 Tax=Salipaludibacillus agaradhaerens TaxID=76935 RepID=A0A9Q4FYK8_SALAG|nr:hypothetical protein [Salipaludibacillus agaradhaerens]MCR6095838.1 hypothetical protein [Salipaludibacillus agaradhaerens]MCR6114602.1 hypothetical protein [Salipaludibacillus agaradhaerens]
MITKRYQMSVFKKRAVVKDSENREESNIYLGELTDANVLMEGAFYEWSLYDEMDSK